MRLAVLDSCAVSDALDKLGFEGVASGIGRLATDRRISGRVVTVKLEADDGRPVASRHLGTTAIEAGAALTAATLTWTGGAWIQARYIERVGARRFVGLGFAVVGLNPNDLLTPGVGALLLGAYALVAVATGAALMQRRDIA